MKKDHTTGAIHLFIYLIYNPISSCVASFQLAEFVGSILKLNLSLNSFFANEKNGSHNIRCSASLYDGHLSFF
jgi:hypothetical protein